MRKGILSFSPLGRRKAITKTKTTNMEKAEKTAAQKAEEAQEQKTAVNEKAYVQTIMVPKQRKTGDAKTKQTAVKKRKNPRKQ